MAERTSVCAICGVTLTDGRRRQCGEPDCKRRYANWQQRRFQAAYKARTGENYGDKYAASKHRKVWMPCHYCGELVFKEKDNRYAKRFCSEACRDAKIRSRSLPVLYVDAPAATVLPQQHPARCRSAQQQRRVWVSHTCTECGCSYLTTRPSWYCGEPCRRKAERLKKQIRKAYIKALERGSQGAFTTSQWGSRLLQYGRRCAYCQDEQAPVEIEHVVPLSRGGSNYITNVVPACRACNQEKGTLTPGEWLVSGKPRVRSGVAGPHRTPAWPSGASHDAVAA